MRQVIFLLSACLFLAGSAATGQSQDGQRDANQNQPPPRSERSKEAGESSSHDSRIDLSPPSNDSKDHPNSTLPRDEADDGSSDVAEFHTFDPHRAAKDIEVGDFYYKRKNYRGALERYQEALLYKPHDALANFRMGQALEKLARPDEAVECYQEYLKILPNGPQAEEAKKALEKLKASIPSEKSQGNQ